MLPNRPRKRLKEKSFCIIPCSANPAKVNEDLNIKRLFILFISGSILMAGCYRPGPGAKVWQVSGVDGSDPLSATLTATPYIVEVPLPTPTPNEPIIMPTPRDEILHYTVQGGDTLRTIAWEYQVTVDQIATANGIVNADQIEVGQVLTIPLPSFDAVASNEKIIPDSELINSPSNAGFDVAAFVRGKNGYLTSYFEEVDGVETGGVEIVERVALEYSVNPRLLLTVLEYKSGWVTESNPDQSTRKYPMGFHDVWLEGLYLQLASAADLLNAGYYQWKANVISMWTLSDDTVIEADPTINPGTAGVLNLMRCLTNKYGWDAAITNGGIKAQYETFFGNVFVYAYEPMIPEDLTQPTLQLPFEVGDEWSFTSGPHGGWDTGSAWAALDFAPPGEVLGCFASNAWVTAIGSGVIVYADNGAVIQDLDGDGIWQTGWSILYMHISSTERIGVGTAVEAGDRIGHPSCEGGFSTGTHLHIARRYNGEWIAADCDVPFVMDGWVPSGYGIEYNGYLTRGDVILEAWDGRSPLNAIKR
jgi:LasA protease